MSLLSIAPEIREHGYGTIASDDILEVRRHCFKATILRMYRGHPYFIQASYGLGLSEHAPVDRLDLVVDAVRCVHTLLFNVQQTSLGPRFVPVAWR